MLVQIKQDYYLEIDNLVSVIDRGHLEIKTNNSPYTKYFEYKELQENKDKLIDFLMKTNEYLKINKILIKKNSIVEIKLKKQNNSNNEICIVITYYFNNCQESDIIIKCDNEKQAQLELAIMLADLNVVTFN